MNPFTPFGDASLVRMANLYANVAQLSRDEDIAQVFEMVTADAARQLGVSHGLSKARQPPSCCLMPWGQDGGARSGTRHHRMEKMA